jgi:hypothetical protein
MLLLLECLNMRGCIHLAPSSLATHMHAIRFPPDPEKEAFRGRATPTRLKFG